ncbi:MAG: SusD/RagB family nutrient-binding outer membrane lipoprotein [Bacteroides pyogenes]|uniref:SusD/RagB family nutrient-binding outer membrane lipoprotein n=2 Tax=Bacteroides pyogenes TaxID=310300 RepID=U2CH32_9BACE|nr:SusD/RagB family nutrient-binding outer membrane lipoprotein [Bacteroides pyogenes]GAE22049.1 hypothetical protein JCM10003_1594 [Bacteroides pyogenes JCM 10003]ERI83850.1 hypothetical protein HMPREF1981_02607 [Bacteroides pyogenes F0041]MBB3896092.1 hypothetical protein [Bacteroides pyogenes]MCI7070940.1 SusD/RagB family nutrient-binding outer membrane lipoprotein [Bacteroides pyogenes]SUV34198.1 lipoprotein [Bacteroides pyogenes]
MKIKKYIYPLLALLMLSACDYEEVNKSTTGVTDDDLKAGGLLYGARFLEMQQLVIPIGSPSKTTGPGNDLQNTDLISSGNYIGYFGNNNNWNFSLESNWNFPAHRMGYAFENFYSNMFRPWSEIHLKLKSSDDPKDREVAAVIDIVKILGWLRATDVFGPIVYTKAGLGETSPIPDSQEVIYKHMLADLAKDAEVLNKAISKVMPRYDLIYDGDVSKWTKLANSLMLRMAVRMHFKDKTLATEYISKALDPANGGVIESQGDEAKIGDSAKMPLLNSMIASIDYKETRLGATIWSYMDGFNDPRLSVLFTKGQWRNKEGFFPVAPTNSEPKRTGPNSAEFASVPKVTPASPLYWFRASETYFLKAEAALYKLTAGSASEFYEKGVRMSFDENKVGNADAYLTQEDVKPTALRWDNYYYGINAWYTCDISDGNITPKWNDADTDEKKLQRIITQKYLALYPNAVEAWTEYRRTGYPYLMKPMDGGAYARIGATLEDGLKTPERFKYSPKFYSDDVTQGLVTGLLGGEDQGATRLWWVRDDRPKQPNN